MTLARFLCDRLPLLLLYSGSSALVLLFLWLGLHFRGVGLTVSEIAYMAILQAFAAFLYLAYDYIRHRLLYRQLKTSGKDFDDVLRIMSPVTDEEEALVRRLHDMHRVYATELLKHRQSQERHLEYVQMWVHQMKTPVSVIALLLQQPPDTAEPERIQVETDRKWLHFMLQQLISNALKYSRLTGRTGLSLDLRVRREGRAVLLQVEDEGIGIPPEDLPRIFEPFFTGENGRLTKEASGMGLYLVKQVLDRLGHRIEVSSCPGEGTTVTIVFETRSLTKLT
ncbi:ATP-binding protein [Aneurinibacillus thermoaerophilus]|uniref:ATP-binding protein n=1 Tax=Aneurinibacillus thermoaerophilus TaxID=143495 RepID=UPI002E1F9119|nr:ATP-binding protein [Aneurinibacillus thermoaerophilus]